MYGGDSDEEIDEYDGYPQGNNRGQARPGLPPPGHGGGGFNALSMLNAAMAGMGGPGPFHRPPGLPFNRRYNAYSIAISEITKGRGEYSAGGLGGGRANVLYGGKIQMPPDALEELNDLQIEGPWMFELYNPRNPEVTTHAGVLEFIADPGMVHLPQWMMNRLVLQEGDELRVRSVTLPKGKLVKLQAQHVNFLELSDPKAVLEQALRNYSALSKDDTIEISYNGIQFELLVMETEPKGPGISVLDTDLEVDFAPPKGYVEPARTPRAPLPTMASKFQINTSSTEEVDDKGSGASTPQAGAVGGPSAFEAFKGKGQSMSGKNIKGRGIKVKKPEEVDKNSAINRTDVPRIVTADTQIGERRVPAALNLPPGTLFFGYSTTTYRSPETMDEEQKQASQPFAGVGSGNSLSGRVRAAAAPSPAASGSNLPSASQASGSGSATNEGGGSAFAGKGHSLKKSRGDVIEID